MAQPLCRFACVIQKYMNKNILGKQLNNNFHNHVVSAFFTLEMCGGQIGESKSESKQRSKQSFNKVEKKFRKLILRKLRLNG